MKHWLRFLFILLPVAWIGCCREMPRTDIHPIPGSFETLRASFVTDWKRTHPMECVGLGFHEYDGKFRVPNSENLGEWDRLLVHYDDVLKNWNEDRLSSVERYDAQLLRHWIATERWTLETERDPYRNPMFYANSMDVSVYLKRDWKPWTERVRDMAAILAWTTDVLAVARQNLEPVLPRPFIQTAIDVAEGTASFLQNDVTREVGKLTDDEVKASYFRASSNAIVELKSYAAWLRNDRLPKANDAFALGVPGFAARLHAEGIDLSPQEILKIGLAELHREQESFASAAREIDPTKPPIDVFKAIQSEHPTAEGLIPDTSRDLEMIRKYVVDQHLVTIPSEVRASVRETLPPFRATSFASMDTPGPFEARATEAYYYVTPVEPEWPQAQKDEWLTAFNTFTTDVVSIHEAYPGHYVQFLAMNASKASEIAKIYNSYAFVEGWAHYAEQMVLDSGFPAGPLSADATHLQRLRAAKFRLAQSDEALLRLCRLCVAIQMHTQGMTVEQGIRFFIDNCYYETKPAASEANRGTFDPGYCFYTLGKLQILKLRQDWQVQEGKQFSLQRFHDALLSHGAPPIRLLREQLLKDPDQWPKIL